MMDDKKLIGHLNSVGKTIFVEYFELFEDYSHRKISKENCIEQLVSAGVSNEAGASIRCSNAKMIFDAKREVDALSIVTQSSRLSASIISRAKRLLSIR